MKPSRRTLHLALLILTAAASFPPGAGAAPFCISNQVLQPPICIYYDAQNCAQEAQRQNAECTTNPAEFRLSESHGEYCVVTSGGASVCAYADYQTCAREASRQQGTCSQARPNQPARQPNPFSAVNGD
jgi:hypothetical protein